MKKILVLLIVVILTCAIPYNAIAEDSEDVKVYSEATIEDDFADNKIMVVLNKTFTAKEKDYLIQDFDEIECIAVDNIFSLSTASNFQKNNDSFRQVIDLTLSKHSKQYVLDCIDVLEDRKDIEYVGPDYFADVDDTVTNDTHIEDQWAITKIQLDLAWPEYYYGNEVRVGVIDSGINGSHPDLSSRIDTGLSRDFSTGSCIFTGTPSDTYGHGTHVAGIIAAVAGNNIGIAGVCSRVKLVSLRAYPLDMSLHWSNVARAISYAETASIPIINLSFSNTSDDYAMRTYMTNYSGIAICSAGNRNQDVDSNPVYPAAYNLPNIISVGNSTINDEKSTNSSWGATTVDLFAPGTNIISCYPVGLCQSTSSTTVHDEASHVSEGYHSLTGTSMAVPYVTGVVAMIKSRCPNMTNEQIISVILNNVDEVAALQGLCVTGGRLNAYKALMAAINGQY